VFAIEHALSCVVVGQIELVREGIARLAVELWRPIDVARVNIVRLA
jgi:hypothetical protein